MMFICAYDLHMSTEKQQESKIQRRYYTTEEIAEILILDKRTVENWRYRSVPYGPPFVHVSGMVRYPVQGFDKWCDELDTTASQTSPG